MTTTLLQTPLHSWHEENNGRLVDFAGWSMPVQYSSIVDEHVATRTKATLFDVSHMGRLRFGGEGATAFLDHLLTRRVTGLADGAVRYSLVTNEQGGILDDVLIYRLGEMDDALPYMMVVNASNREKIVEWIGQHVTDDVTVEDHTIETAMIAAQGPTAWAAITAVTGVAVDSLRYYEVSKTTIEGQESWISRTGYTGEDGCELIVPAALGLPLWQQLLEAGAAGGMIAAGLGARDTLRLEAAMPLYGHELNEDIDPLQAGLGFAIQFKDRNFIGRDALLAKKSDATALKRVGLVKPGGGRVPREHSLLVVDGNQVGEVTSGTFSPTLKEPIAMAYVQPEFAATGTELSVDIRGRCEPVTVVDLPFYSRKS
ncbi:MAG: aminomethyltransferase [Pirellulaceae bacterium]|jgi:aminomethyltransferase